MVITEKTPYSDIIEVEELFADTTIKELKQAAEKKYGDCYNLTIDEFFGLIEGNYSLLGDITEPTALQVYWLKRFEEFCTEFANSCERMTLQPTDDQTQLQTGCLKLSGKEGMLIFTREYFGLPSFMAAGKRTLGEYLVARKDKYNEAVQKRNFDAWQRRKIEETKRKNRK